MGMDKKPTPPPKRIKEERGRGGGTKEMERTAEEAASHSECETGQTHDTETPVNDETVAEDKPRDGTILKDSYGRFVEKATFRFIDVLFFVAF